MSQCHFVVTQQFSYRVERPPCNHLTFRELFHEMTIDMIHAPKALKPCSLALQVITVSSTTIVACRQSGADEHHTASSYAIRSPAFARSSFHARATHLSSASMIRW